MATNVAEIINDIINNIIQTINKEKKFAKRMSGVWSDAYYKGYADALDYVKGIVNSARETTPVATDVTQQEETFQEVINYCEKKINELYHDLDILEEHQEISDTVSFQVQGQAVAYEDIERKCHHMFCKEVNDGD